MNSKSSKPLYQQVLNDLRRNIEEGTYSPDSLLPSEQELTDLFGVSRPTVRRALQILTQDGLIDRKPGLGTYVRRKTTAATRQHKTGNLVLIIPELRDAFHVQIIAGAEQVAAQYGYHLILSNTGNQIAVEQNFLQELWELNKTDGFLIMAADSPRPHLMLQDMNEQNVPMVFIDRYFKDLEAPYVTSDNVRGGYMVTRHLIELGHQHIAFITRPILYVSTVAERLQGYKQALNEAGIAYNPGLIFQELLPYMSEVQVREPNQQPLADYDLKVLRSFLEYKDRPSAVICCNDVIALQFMIACQELNIRIPEELALTSFDDDAIAPYLSPPLTTVRQDTRGLGARAADLLINILHSDAPEESKIILPMELIVRASCGARSNNTIVFPEKI